MINVIFLINVCYIAIKLLRTATDSSVTVTDSSVTDSLSLIPLLLIPLLLIPLSLIPLALIPLLLIPQVETENSNLTRCVRSTCIANNAE